MIKQDVPAGQDTTDLGYGLLTEDGREKPAAASVRALFDTGTLDTAFNGDFASGSSGLPDDWRITDPAAAMGAAVWDPAVGHDRPGSVVVRHTGSGDSGVAELTVTPVVQPSAAGEVFTLAAWAQSAGPGGAATIAIEWLDPDGQVVASASSAPFPADAIRWQLLTVTSAAPPRAASVRVCLRTGGAGGSVRYDDVAFGPAAASR